MTRPPPRSTLFPYTTLFRSTVKSGLSMPEDNVLPGPIKLHSKAATVYKRAMDDTYQADRGIGALSAYARSEEHTSELQSHVNLVCRLLLEKKKNQRYAVTVK